MDDEEKSLCDNMSIITSETSLGEFKIPSIPAPRKRKKKVLHEEIYVRNLGDIIERDFFPELDNLKDKLDYVKASETNDMDILRELYSKYSDTPSCPITRVESPATFDTPAHIAGAATPNRDKGTPVEMDDQRPLASGMTTKAAEKNLPSLDKFMANYTSEDNESFEQVMEEQEKKFKLKHPWLFEAEAKHNALYTPNLALPSIAEQHQQKLLALTGIADKSKDIRPPSVENWTYKTYNSVMYVPDVSPFSNRQLLELAKFKQREVLPENTRFTENPFNETLSQTAMLEASAIQAYKKEGKVGIDGKELKESPSVNGYSYCRTPSPAPGVNCTPLMTWGQIEGTPFQLDGSTTPLIRGKNVRGPSYSIPKISDRDEVHLRLAGKASQNHRTPKTKALNAARNSLTSPIVKKSSNLERLSSMSPAAQKLFSAKLGINRSVDRALQASYTPSPIQHSTIPSTPKCYDFASSANHPSTPLATKRPFTPSSEVVGLTDNLLKLPKRVADSPKTPVITRNCASDFF